jgi:hypothetical protein
MSFEEKSPVIQELLKKITGNPMDGKTCAICGSDKVSREDFVDGLSWKEFGISRMCQKCQDGIFE